MVESDNDRISRERMEDDLEGWYLDRGSRDMTTNWATFGQPLPPLPIEGHANCVVPGCIGYTRSGSRCADHVTKTVS